MASPNVDVNVNVTSKEANSTPSTDAATPSSTSTSTSTQAAPSSTSASASPTSASVTTTINLIQLAATSLSAAILASYPIVQYASSSNTTTTTTATTTTTRTRTKSDGSLVTDADGDAQRIIFGVLHRSFPTVRIVGEESDEDMARGQVGLMKSLHEPKSEATEDGTGTAMAMVGTTTTAPTTTNGTATSFSPGTKRKWKEMEEDREGTIRVTIEKEIALRVSTHLKHNNNNRNDKDDDDDDDNDDDATKDNDSDEKNKVVVDPSRVSVFVDPLDGTSAYAKGQYKYVTILIAIMVDNVPVFGVICKPFGDEDGLTSFGDTDHSAMYGGTLLGGIFCVGGGELERSRVYNANTAAAVAKDTGAVKAKTNGDKNSTNDNDNGNDNGTTKIENGDSKDHLKRRRAIISKSKAGGVVQECIQSLSSKNLLHPQPLYITGAGYKTLVLLLGQKEETLWFFPKPGTSLWDVAAADALLRATGGRLTDSLNQDLDYSKSRTEASNDNGIVACCDSELHATCMELYESENWKDE